MSLPSEHDGQGGLSQVALRFLLDTGTVGGMEYCILLLRLLETMLASTLPATNLPPSPISIPSMS